MRHAVAVLIAAFALASLPSFTLFSQEDPDPAPRQVTVQLAGVSRGYARPLSRTADRVRALPGIESAEARGAGGDCVVLSVTTRLDNEALASAMGGVLLASDAKLAVIAPADDKRSRRAIARHAIAKIAAAIMDQPRPHWRQSEGAELFAAGDSLAVKLRKLGLEAELADVPGHAGRLQIQENWQGSGGTYRVWAGEKWEGVPIFDDGRWWSGDETESSGTLEADANSGFVGAEVTRSSWSSGVFWADLEGAMLDSALGARAETTWEGDLKIHAGKKWMQDILAAIVAIRVKEPRRQVDEMPKGRGWTILRGIEDMEDLQRWGTQGYHLQALQLDWKVDDEGRWSLRFRAHHPGHALYLDAELDVDAAIAHYKTQEGASESPARVDVADRINWLVDAEESEEVFKLRRNAVIESMSRLREALKAAAGQHELGELCGRLSDPELQKRLGVEFDGANDIGAAQYVIRGQLFGDVEIAAGEPSNGGTRWILLNPASGKVLRSYQ